jgi:pilus assembly protein Flp/PilA
MFQSLLKRVSQRANGRFPIPARSLHISEPGGKNPMNDLFLKLFVMAQSLMTRDDGQDLVEYALLVSLIALAAISGVKHVATAVNNVFSNVSSSLA